MLDEELHAWIRLSHTPGLSAAMVRALLGRFGSASAAAGQSAASLGQQVGPQAARAWEAGAPATHGLFDQTRTWLAQADPGEPRQVITLGDPGYPDLWLESPDPPLLVYVLGDVQALSRPCLAMVGTRHPTPQGKEDAQAFARAFSQAGWCVVSGLALGVDAAAHQGGLQGAGGTVAIVGTGLDRVYPRAHHALAHQIARQGALVSEFPLGSPPLAGHFPRRNRLIASLGRGTLVVEAAVRSGSLITARLAAEAGREVFAMPGSIHSPQSRGCHWLIKQGAKLVETAEDVLVELGAPSGLGRVSGKTAARATSPGSAQLRNTDTDAELEAQSQLHTETEATAETLGASQPTGDPARAALLEALGHDPVDLDRLSARTGWPVAQLQGLLLELELRGLVARCADGRYQRMMRA